MNVECPNCRMISAVAGDQILTSQHDMKVACPNCNFRLVLELQIDPQRAVGDRSAKDLPENQPKEGSPRTQYSHKRSATAALKAKILRSLVNLPPMPHIILKAREIIADTDIDQDILKHLKINAKDLDTITLAMLDDVKKIEEEAKEG